VSKATGGRGRAVERAHFCVSVTLRARSGERARATPLFRSRPNLFRSFHPSLRQEIFFSPLRDGGVHSSLGKCLGRSYSFHSLPTTNPGRPSRYSIACTTSDLHETGRSLLRTQRDFGLVVRKQRASFVSLHLCTAMEPSGTLHEDAALGTFIWLANSG